MNPKHAFTHLGREYQLIKRTGRPHWYFRLVVAGKDTWVDTQTTLAANAVIKAKAALDARVEGRWDAFRTGTRLRAPASATVAEAIKVYETAPGIDASTTTRTHYINCLKNVLRTVHKTEDPGALPLTSCNLETLKTWFAMAVAPSETLNPQLPNSQLDLQRAKRTANSIASNAVCLFTDRALEAYRDAHLALPQCLEEFHRGYKLRKFTKLPTREYNPPDDLTIARTLANWLQLEDREVFLAIGLELSFGLRKAECAQARWDWFTTRQSYPVLDGEADVKNGSGRVQARALDPFWTQLVTRAKAQGWWGSTPGSAGVPPATSTLNPQPSTAYILTGSTTQRTSETFNRVSAWLRTQGWQTQKTNHALREYAGSMVAMRYGIYEAQVFLRHASVQVTEQHYSGFVKRFKPADLEALPCKWAVAETQPFTPVILNSASA